MPHILYQASELNSLQERLNRMNPVDLAEEFKHMTAKEIILRMKLLSKDLLADTFAEMSSEKKTEILTAFTDENVNELIHELDSDELVDTIQEMPANIVRKIMNSPYYQDKREQVNQLLGYPEESVGSIMSVDYLFIKDSFTHEQAINLIKQSDLDAEKLEQIWITDPHLHLQGFIYLVDLIRYPDQSIEDLTHYITRSVYALDDQEVVAKLVQKYDLAEIPVVDTEGRLIGVVPVEWAVDVISEEYQEDMSNMQGITRTSEHSYLDKTAFEMAKSRTTWLVICLITATITGFIIQRYEGILSTSIALSVYIPMLMDSGGNAGSQASTTIISSLYSGDIRFVDFWNVIRKEISVGMITGIALLLVNLIRMMILDGVDVPVMMTVSITLFFTVIISKLIGGILPLLADKLKVDPTVMAGPIITTVVDTLSLLIYFEVASVLLGY